ncbi:transcriptional regulator [Vulcanibacillus modesticaldus]|uniref:Transcriptional regulator n=1 Tax=Vulcanibacillus modesticaldus TaxID=337097 RepID=A0A1D2YWS6_9BACI|nr:MerR family transcriptional regulator [Vulcanibacillus modesticaldus]OEG00169.1 transcriptional regulator [Vulcanibacillus modesticaldus]
MNDFERRNRPLFPISIVMELTELTARQIRYYEEQQLIKPARTKGKHRLFSFADIDRLLEIKSLLDKKVNLAGIKEIFRRRELEEQEKALMKLKSKERQISDSELRRKLVNEVLHQKSKYANSQIQGDLSRFFH